MKAVHDSRDSFYRTPFGAQPTDGQVCLRVCAQAETARLRLWIENAERVYDMRPIGLHGGLYAFEADITLPDKPCLVWYFFVLEGADGTRCYGAPADQLGGEGCFYEGEPPSFQITVYDKAFAAPTWLRDGVMYHIFVDRFHDGERGALLKKRGDIAVHDDWYEAPYLKIDPRSGDNMAMDFFGGNLKGIEEKLPYLQKLGVTVLYLSPVFRARSNHKYDTGDYMEIDPTFGTEADFDALCAAARARGIRVMLDGVFSHNGEDSRYFNRCGTYDGVGAYQSPDSPFYSWYKFEQYPDRYKCWWGVPTLPEVNEGDPSYRAFIMGEDGVAAHWLRCGASGWRLDVADELPDDFIELLRMRVKQADADAALLGEVWEDATNKVSYDTPRTYALGRALDSVMNYPLREALTGFLTGRIDAFDLKRSMDSQRENYPPPLYYSLMNLMGSHDRARALNVLAERTFDELPREERRGARLSEQQRALARRRLMLMARVVFSMPGMPCVYYGDEAGMEGAADPFNRACFPWGREDEALTGFIRSLAAERAANAVLTQGKVSVDALSPDVLCIKRELRGQQCMLYINRADAPAHVVLDLEHKPAMLDQDGGLLLPRVQTLLIPPVGAHIVKSRD